MTFNPFQRFRLIAFAEGCSFLCFAITMPLKYVFSIPQPNYVVGMIHGFLFLLYLVLLLQVAYLYKWSFKIIFLSFIASLVPFGTFYADKKIFKIPMK